MPQAWQQLPQSKREIGLEEWARTIGFAQPILTATKERTLKETSLTKIKNLRAEVKGKDLAQIIAIASPLQLVKVTVSKDGVLKGMPAATAGTAPWARNANSAGQQAGAKDHRKGGQLGSTVSMPSPNPLRLKTAASTQ